MIGIGKVSFYIKVCGKCLHTQLLLTLYSCVNLKHFQILCDEKWLQAEKEQFLTHSIPPLKNNALKYSY